MAVALRCVGWGLQLVRAASLRGKVQMSTVTVTTQRLAVTGRPTGRDFTETQQRSETSKNEQISGIFQLSRTVLC